jgi:hypothetical protein
MTIISMKGVVVVAAVAVVGKKGLWVIFFILNSICFYLLFVLYFIPCLPIFSLLFIIFIQSLFVFCCHRTGDCREFFGLHYTYICTLHIHREDSTLASVCVCVCVCLCVCANEWVRVWSEEIEGGTEIFHLCQTKASKECELSHSGDEFTGLWILCVRESDWVWEINE